MPWNQRSRDSEPTRSAHCRLSSRVRYASSRSPRTWYATARRVDDAGDRAGVARSGKLDASLEVGDPVAVARVDVLEADEVQRFARPLSQPSCSETAWASCAISIARARSPIRLARVAVRARTHARDLLGGLSPRIASD